MKELKIFFTKIRPTALLKVDPLSNSQNNTLENKSAKKVKHFSPINSPCQSYHNPPPALSLPSPP